MQNKRKRINYCRLFLREGRFHRIERSADDSLIGAGGGYFAYLAPMFDTMDIGSSFHRFIMHGEFQDCKYEVIAAATNIDISEVMLAEGMSPREQTEILKELKYVRKVNSDDFLLHELEGRYLWVQIIISAARVDSRFEIAGFEVEFPKSSFVEYLPEIYQNQKDTFFCRYLAALQSLYENLEMRVSEVPQMLDYETTDEGNLNDLSGWVGFAESGITYTPEQLRILIRDLTEIQAGKGTVKVLKKMLKLITGRDVYIVEYFKWHDWMKNSQGFQSSQGLQSSQSLIEDYAKIYGSDESMFTVLIDFQGTKGDELPDSEWVKTQMEEYTPFGMKSNLAYLTESNHLDTHCYLGVNSYLSTPVTADTKGFVLGGNFVLG